MDRAGRSVAGAFATVTSNGLPAVQARTNTFGMFTARGLPVGRNYTVSIQAKRGTWQPQVVELSDNVVGLEFRAQ